MDFVSGILYKIWAHILLMIKLADLAMHIIKTFNSLLQGNEGEKFCEIKDEFENSELILSIHRNQK